MTTEEIAELFLVHLYELSEAAPHPNFLFTVNDFAPALEEADREKLNKALIYLGDRGLVITASMDMTGGISAGITADGSIFVEKGGETGIIGEYRRSRGLVTDSEAPDALTTTPFNPAPAAAAPCAPCAPAPAGASKTAGEGRETRFFASRAVSAILDDIQDMLERDNSVSAELRTDLVSDLATLKIQVARNVKNKAVIQAMLENLSGIPSVTPLVTALNCIVDAYFL
jgi:flagellar biosynthesis regulator FlaF